MDSPDQPQIYIISPAAFELSQFPGVLARVLDSIQVACVRLDLISRDEDTVSRAADAVREITHARDVALVISDHVLLAQRLGLEGVHLGDAARSVRKARKTLGPDAIVGSYCGSSRHDGLTAGEAGADYVSFGPLAASALMDGDVADTALFQWWSEMIELPAVAEGNLEPERIAELSPFTDFFGIGDEIWRTDDPVASLQTLQRAMV